jgi:hypothetical protein
MQRQRPAVQIVQTRWIMAAHQTRNAVVGAAATGSSRAGEG